MSNAFLTGLLSNMLLASALTILALAIGRLCRNPHVSHALWLLVLLKLVTPPIIEVPIPSSLGVISTESPTAASIGASDSRRVETTVMTPGQPRSARMIDTGRRLNVAEAQRFPFSWRGLLLAGWSLGTVALLSVAFRRHAKFSHLVSESRLATANLVDDANSIASKMGLSACPQVRTTDVRVSPLVTGAWRQRVILLPRNLLVELSRDQMRTVLAHELAHILRRDHLIQLLKFSILAVQWWNPIAWFASRQLEHAQEACCDAWVVWALPEHRRAYGQTLLRTVEFMSERRLFPVMSETFMAQCNLERRIEMVLKRTVPRRGSPHTIGFILVAGLVFLPTAVTLAVASEPPAQTSKRNASGDKQGDERSARSTPPSHQPTVDTADLPHTVAFEQGATRFLDGDEIAIHEVRGTAKTFERGHIYRIKGTYKLASHDKATIAAYTTATNASEGRSRSMKVQHLSVDQGTGDFTLFLPMSVQGWPHVSFYPQDGGEGFGGNYFGTGEYVLKQWWAERKEQPSAHKQVIRLDRVLWTDAPELRARLGEKIYDSLQLGLVARVENYGGDWEALKRHQATGVSKFWLEAEDSPPLQACMRTGGITFGSGEAWVLLHLEGQPSAGVQYTLRAPDPNWVVASSVPTR
ncbi:MAG: M56 family metallopeptidase [Planctomycetota bacterium]